MPPVESPPQPVHSGVALPLWKAWLPSLLILAAALLLAGWLQGRHRQELEERFTGQAEDIRDALREALARQEATLRAGAGLLAVTPEPTLAQWEAFVAALPLAGADLGTRGLGFCERVEASGLDAYLRSLPRRGLTRHVLRPPGQRPEYCLTFCVAPVDPRNTDVCGHDIYASPERREAADRARDTGQPALTAGLVLASETNTAPPAGVLFMSPFYRPGLPLGSVAERRAALRGFVKIPLRVSDLVRATLGARLDSLGLRIDDSPAGSAPPTGAQAGAPLFSASAPANAIFTWKGALETGGRRWTLSVAGTDPGGMPAASQGAMILLVLGALLAASVRLIIQGIDATRARAESLALRMTDELRQGEAYNRALFLHSCMPVGVTGSDGRIVDVNPAMTELLGYDRQELLGRRWLEVTHPDDREASQRLLRAAQESGDNSYQLEKRYLRKDGSVIWARLSVAFVPGEDGALRWAVGAVRDVSALRQAEDAERRRRALHEAMFENNRSICLLTDPQELRIVDANPAACAFTGYSREELRGLPLARLNVTPGLGLGETANSAAKSGGVFAFVYRLKDGGLRNVQVNANPFESGGRILLLSTVQDVTGSMQAEAALSESRERFHSLVESMDQGVIMCDKEDRISYANPAFARLLGQTGDELEGVAFRALLPPDEGEAHTQRMEQRRKGSREAYETPLLRADLTPLLARIMPFALYDAGGQYLGSCGLVTDITARSAAEAVERQRQQRRTALLRLHQMRDATRQEILDYALEQALRISASAFGAFYLHDAATGQFQRHMAAASVSAGLPGAGEICRPDDRGPLGEALRRGAPVLRNDGAGGTWAEGGECLSGAMLRRLLAVPVTSDGRVRALLCVADRQQPYGEEDVAQLRLFTDGLWSILERQEAERELRLVTERYELAVRAGRVGLWDWDLASGRAECDQGLRAMLGLAPEDLAGAREDWLRLVHPDDAPAVCEVLAHAARTGGRFETVFRMRRKDGSELEVEASAQAGSTGPGRPDRLVLVFMDVTSLRRAEQELKKSHSFLQDIIDSLPHPFFCKDEVGRYLLVNRAFAELRGGRPIADYLGRRIADVDPPDLAGEHEEQDARLLEAGPGAQLSYEQARPLPSGGLDRRIVYKALVRLEDGRRCIVGVNMDNNLRKRAETRLEKSHRFLQGVLDAMPLPFTVKDAEGRFVLANEACRAAFGFDPAQVLGRRLDEVTGCETSAMLLREERDMLAQGETGSRSLEVDSPSPAGMRRLLVIKSRLALPEDGSIGVASIVLDITARKQAEEGLKEERRRLADVIEGTNAGTWEWNIKTGELVVNERWAEMLGYTRQELAPVDIGTWYRLIHPDDAEISAKALERHFAGEAPFYDCECRLRHRDGRLIWVHDRGQVFRRAADGSPLLMSGTHSDISERKAAEQALSASEKRFRTLTQISPVCIFQADARGRCTYVNDQWTGISGLPPERALGLGWLRTLRREDRKVALHGFRDMVKSGCDYVAEFRFHGEGEGRWVLMRAAVERDDAGGLLGVVGALTDVSELKRAQDVLRLAKAEAEAATRAKAQFLANMSHEIRTPLAGVVGAARLLAQSALDGEQRRLAEMAQVSGQALLAVVNDILDFSKIEAGKMALRPGPFSLRALLDSVAGPAQVLAAEAGLAFRLEVDSAAPDALVGDATRLGQVLRNLLGNAVKFTPKGEVVLSVVFTRRAGAEVWLRFAVRDTGVGIDPDYLPRIFDSFSQADSSYGKQHAGTGLGLAICKSLVEQMRGVIEVHSDPGLGSLFTATLPLGMAPDLSGVGPRPEEAPAPARPSDDQAPLRVLLAEDNDISRMLAEHMLRRAGHRVTGCADGQAALEALVAGEFDLVLMDVQMPRLDGVEAVRRLRRGEAGARNAGIPVLGVTAYAAREDREGFLAEGMNEVLTKPVDENQLVEAVRRLAEEGGACARASGDAAGPVVSAASVPDGPRDLPPRRDQGYLERSYGGSPELLARMLEEFLERSLPAQRRLLEQALAAGDVAQGRVAAHSLRGTLGAIGAARGAHLAALAEKAALAGEAGAFGLAVRDLLEELAAVAAHLEGGLPWRAEEE